MNKLFILSFLLLSTTAFSQKKIPDNWQLLSPQSDKVYGMGVEQAYKLLKGKTPKTVIVAVIDSGVEIDHEDLKGAIWTNTGEIPENGIDDDKNGYIDDVHGWSFIGGKTEDINYESLELARIYYKVNKKFAALDTNKLSASDKNEWTDFIEIRAEFLGEQDQQKKQLVGINLFSNILENVKKENNGEITKKGLKKYKPANAMEKKIRKRLKLLFALGLSPSDLNEQVTASRTMIENMLENNNKNSDSIRAITVGDDPSDLTEKYYGCNRVEGPDALHGTHVAGIIAAIRNNKIGINGVASNVRIMPVRAVPNGDERDKDIANAIYYAVDNGASVINMSFGKYYSPNKKLVDAAIEYAASKDVLLIHAAGNEGKNSDLDISFPNRELLSGKIADNWIQVGANAYKPGKKMLASFSNYGARRVDLFAPGVNIYSTVTDNKYLQESGTSMASPATAGVAALIRGYFPNLTAKEVKDVLMRSVVTYKKSVKVPGTRKDKKKMSELCISGGFVSASNAVSELLGIKAAN